MLNCQLLTITEYCLRREFDLYQLESELATITEYCFRLEFDLDWLASELATITEYYLDSSLTLTDRTVT